MHVGKVVLCIYLCNVMAKKSLDLTVITSYPYAIYQLDAIHHIYTPLSHDNYVISIMESLN